MSDVIFALEVLSIPALMWVAHAACEYFDKKQRRMWFRHWRQM